MARTAQAKKTSEQRCEDEFLARFGTDEDWAGEPEKWVGLVIGWQACWRYLEKQVREEFIER